MALWIILGVLAAIILIIVILLHFSVKAYVEADKTRLFVSIKYLGFKVYTLELPNKEKDEEPPETSDSSVSEEDFTLTELEEADSTYAFSEPEPPKSEGESNEAGEASIEDTDESKPEGEEESQKPEKTGPSLLEQFNEYKKFLPAGKKALRKLLKLIRFYKLNLSLSVGNEDPYKAGLNFGRINAAVYSLLGLLCSVFTVTIDSTDITCDFEHKAFDFRFSTFIYVRPSAVVALAAYLGVIYLRFRISKKKLEKTAKEINKNE